MSIEYRDQGILPIQRVGIALYRKAEEFGLITDVSIKFLEKLQLAFTVIYRLHSVQSIIEKTNPNYRAGSYLIFSPHVKPKNSLCWLSGEDPELRLGGKDELEKWNYNTFMSPHYEINVPIVSIQGRNIHADVYTCVNKHGRY